MIKVRTFKQIASSRTIPSFRSCRMLNRDTRDAILDQRRSVLSYGQVLASDSHRKWRSGLWQVRR